MYYLGTAGCVRVAGLVIAGASGIYKSHDYMRGHYERVPFSPSDVRSAYHTRQYEITKLALLPRPDIFLSHDWPNGIEQYGDVASLLRRKPFFRDEIRTSTLGSPPLQTLLHDLKPRYWFAAHLHVEFHARVDHGGRPAQAAPPLQANPEAIAMDDLSDDDSMAPSQAAHDTPSPLTPSTTEFLALGKCTRHGGYLHVRRCSHASFSRSMRRWRTNCPAQTGDLMCPLRTTLRGSQSHVSWTTISQCTAPHRACPYQLTRGCASAWQTSPANSKTGPRRAGSVWMSARPKRLSARFPRRPNGSLRRAPRRVHPRRTRKQRPCVD